MYITSDGEETIHEAGLDIGAGIDRHAPRSVESNDVKKAGMIITQTPRALRAKANGNERLLSYFKYIEASIAKEVAGRKADIVAIRAQMAKNMELNEAARSKMEKALLKKMAENAKKAKDDLDSSMRKVQATFAKTAEFENKRYKHNLARSAKTREIMRKNKKLAGKNLANAVLAQQRSLAALAQSTAAKIKATKKRIHTNAETIAANAKKARAELDHAMGNFNKKMANVEEEAKKGRSKLAAQAATQDKKFRQYANNKVKTIVAQTAAEFAKVRKQMAKDRAHADKAIADTSKRMDAALKAQAALNNRNFAKTVSDIAAAKKEANARVKAFTTSFKASILGLAGVAEAQIKTLDKRQAELAHTVENNKLTQARINDKVNKELNQMIAVGQKRYKAGLKKDRDLMKLMEKNAADTAARMARMKNTFMNGLDKIKAQMKKDRAHAEHALAKNTGALYATLKANAEAQDKVNKQISGDTVKAGKEAASQLKIAKDEWMEGIAKMHQKINSEEAKHNGQLLKLTGIVAANAIKDKKGRDQLKKVQAFNKAQVQGALQDAIKKGEQRALQIEKSQRNINKKMRTNLNTRIVTEISSLKARINKQLLELRYNTPASRALMKKQVDMAITVATAKAKANLKKAVADAEGAISKLNSQFKGKKITAALAGHIKATKASIMAKLGDAVQGQEKALLAYRTEGVEGNGFSAGTAYKKKKKFSMTAAADKMVADANAVETEMNADIKAINAKLEKAKKAAVAELEAVSVSSAKRYAAVVADVQTGLKKALAGSNLIYVKVYKAMAAKRKGLDEDLSASVSTLNDNIAKYAALQNSAFSKTVKNIGKARKAAAADVMDSRKIMASTLYATVSSIKEIETRLMGEVAVVSGYLMSSTAAQNRITKAVSTEIAGILKTANARVSTSVRAKGVLRKLMDENKVAASQEVSGLFKSAMSKLITARSRATRYLSDFQDDLKDSTAKLYKALATKSDKAAGAGKDFDTKINSLSNAITANQKHVQDNLASMTLVTFKFSETTPTDRECIGILTDAMKADMNKALVSAIQFGILKAKNELDDEGVKGALLTTVSSAIESAADKAFAAVESNRAKIADNYLSLKAYAMTASDAIEDYVAKGKGRYLSSIGDLLGSIGGLSDVEAGPAPGMGFGTKSLPLLFSGTTAAVSPKETKINGLVNEYVNVVGQVRQRWPMGLGKYLIGRLESAMEGTGALEVDKVQDKAGNFVFVNGHAVGLSSKLSSFEALAVRMSAYESTLAKLTGNLAKTLPGAGVHVFAKPPEWQGD